MLLRGHMWSAGQQDRQTLQHCRRRSWRLALAILELYFIVTKIVTVIVGDEGTYMHQFYRIYFLLQNYCPSCFGLVNKCDLNRLLQYPPCQLWHLS